MTNAVSVRVHEDPHLNPSLGIPARLATRPQHLHTKLGVAGVAGNDLADL